MKQNWWKLVVVVVLVVAVVGVVATKNKGTDKAQTPVIDNSATVTKDDKPAVTVKNDSFDKAEPETSEPAADGVEAQVQKVAEGVDTLKDDAKANDATAKPTAQKPEASALKTADTKPQPVPAKTASKGKHLPKLVDLGATKCIPCKMMAPILEELSREHKGKLEVVFIDVWENEEAGKKYNYKTIPTQILFDENGKEFFRHEGFIPKEDILAKFKEQGITFTK